MNRTTQLRQKSMQMMGLLAGLAMLCLLNGCDTRWLYPSPKHPKTADARSSYSSLQNKDPLVNPSGTRPRNIILCIGDGMGINQVSLARDSEVGLNGRLWMETMPYTALVSTHNVSGNVTDSAEAITAILCGVKTSSSRLGMDPDGSILLTLPERLREEGYRIGVAVTSTISHATPAGTAAHVPSRKMEDRIAVQMFEAGFDVLFGGGKKYWLPSSQPGGSRTDGRDLVREARQAGWQIVKDKQEMDAVSSGRVIGLFQDDALTTLPPEPSLEEMTAAALRVLSSGPSSRPFFLMVEGSQIDWGCHQNEAAKAIRQTLLFDMAIRAALEFAIQDKHTLVIVTADHETGALTLSGGKNEPGHLKPNWASQGHSGGQVPLYAYGPGAQSFTGVMDNTEISKKITKLLGLDNFPRVEPQKQEAACFSLEEPVYAMIAE
jgi:alkaline phosphatase